MQDVDDALAQKLPWLDKQTLADLTKGVHREFRSWFSETFSSRMEDEAVAEFEALLDRGDESGAQHWLTTHSAADNAAVADQLVRLVDTTVARVESVRDTLDTTGTTTQEQLDFETPRQRSEISGWSAVYDYIGKSYASRLIGPKALRLVLGLPNSRSQLIIIRDQRDKWVELRSVVGKDLDNESVQQAAREAWGFIGVGISIDPQGLVFIRGAIPYHNLTTESLENLLHLITQAADNIEEKVTGGDSF